MKLFHGGLLRGKAKVRLWRETLSGRRSEQSRHAVSHIADINCAGIPIRVIVDVGANVGNYALDYRSAFPEARIVCLEPVSKTFALLQKAIEGRRIETHRLALGERRGRATIFLTPYLTTNSLIRPDETDIRGTEEVAIETLDSLAAAHDLRKIDILKIDVEGFDLAVLQGASELMRLRRVRFILIEVGFHPGDSRHVLFDDVRSLLMPLGFRLFGIYDQSPEWSGEPRLRFANALFCLQD
jgi:FkbM family methyltransferase